MTFRGRGFRRPTVIRTATAAGVSFRADCGENPEAWAELSLTRAELAAALRMVDAIGGLTDPLDGDDGDDDPPADADATPLAPAAADAELDDCPGAIVPSHEVGEG